MPTTPFDATDPARRNFLRDSDWTLCVGAGVCNGIMPDWRIVARHMLCRASGRAIKESDFTAIVGTLGWSLDSLLQHALNLYQLSGRTLEDFNKDLSSELYGQLLETAAKAGVADPLAEFLSDPFSRNPAHILPLHDFLCSTYGNSSVMQIARALLKAKAASCAPNAVLTFNADVLLHAALTLLQIRENYDSTGNLSADFHYRGIHRATDRPRSKIPIFHIHGSITPIQGSREAREKLIFPESSYLQLAGSVYSWPQTVFLSAAQSSRIVFVGLSMSDPNIRRWLSWCDGYRRAEIAQYGSATPFSSQHLWMTTQATDPNVQEAKAAGLLHLGVRTAFLPSWNVLEQALSNLLDL